MAQTIQILRTTTNTPPPTLLPGALSAELGPQTKLWIGAAAGNRLLLSTDPTDITLSGGAIIASAAPNAMPGSLWWDSNIGQLYIRYFDGNSTAWVTASNGSNIAIPLGVASGGTGSTSLPLNNGGATYGVTTTLLRTNGTVVSPISGAGGTVGSHNDNSLDVLGLNASPAVIMGRANGTFASPTAVLAGQYLGAVTFEGSFAGSWDLSSRAAIGCAASENWTSTANGTSLEFITTAIGTLTTNPRMTLSATSLNLIGAVDLSNISVMRLQFNGRDFATNSYDGTNRYQVIFDASGNGSIWLGDTVDTINYYQQTGHAFTDRPGTSVYARIDPNGLSLREVRFAFNDPLNAGFNKIYDNSGNITFYLGNNTSQQTNTYAQAQHQFTNRTAGATWALFDATNTRNVSGAWAVISDPSMKEDVTPYTRGLDAVLALEPVLFKYRAGTPFAPEAEPSRPLMGLMADQVKPHVPEIVGRSSIAMMDDDNLEVDTLEPGNLIYAVINAIKELNIKVEALAPAPPAARR